MFTLSIVLAYYYGLITSGNASEVVIKDYIVTEALVAGLNPQMLIGIVEHESGFNCDAVGDHGESFGCWQIHKPTQKKVRPISVKDAKDIIKSTTWAIKTIQEDGDCHQWSTCKEVMREINQDSS
uniref:Transglycosylase SLT domain-containing protein n=1 Tax=uncultured marine virus TaxID=186617 RepID=A0A0F7L9M2_9VIRU|nr:hypothetical protein [uncultured marine virus]